MNTISFFGGSIPAGIGYPETKESKVIYPRLIEKQGFKIQNYSRPGSSNYEIFLSCCRSIAKDHSDIVVIEWNTLQRFWFYPKFDHELIVNAAGISVNEQLKSKLELSNSELKKFKKYLLMMSNDYKSILDLLDYCIILQDYARSKSIELVMINGSTPWTEKLFQDPQQIKNIELETDNFTKSTLDTENLSDKEVLQWWDKIYQKYKKINLEKWVCFLEKIVDYKIDYAPLDNHPGPKSHKIFAEIILKSIYKRV